MNTSLPHAAFDSFWIKILEPCEKGQFHLLTPTPIHWAGFVICSSSVWLLPSGSGWHVRCLINALWHPPCTTAISCNQCCLKGQSEGRGAVRKPWHFCSLHSKIRLEKKKKKIRNKTRNGIGQGMWVGGDTKDALKYNGVSPLETATIPHSNPVTRPWRTRGPSQVY